MINLSTFIIILTSAFSQSLAQSPMSQQQLLVQTSDFTFSMDQEPITINYVVAVFFIFKANKNPWYDNSNFKIFFALFLQLRARVDYARSARSVQILYARLTL